MIRGTVMKRTSRAWTRLHPPLHLLHVGYYEIDGFFCKVSQKYFDNCTNNALGCDTYLLSIFC